MRCKYHLLTSQKVNENIPEKVHLITIFSLHLITAFVIIIVVVINCTLPATPGKGGKMKIKAKPVRHFAVLNLCTYCVEEIESRGGKLFKDEATTGPGVCDWCCEEDEELIYCMLEK